MLGFCTAAGGASSHVAILARALDIPAVAGIEPRALEIADGTPVILDGSKGTLRLNVPRSRSSGSGGARPSTRAAGRARAADEPAVTPDGHQVEVVANIGGLEDAQAAMTKGGEGVGLLRSEFVFLERAGPHRGRAGADLTDIARAVGPGRPLVIRTLDVGGDKPLPYLPIAKEENPFLGVRGIRVGLDRRRCCAPRCGRSCARPRPARRST